MKVDFKKLVLTDVHGESIKVPEGRTHYDIITDLIYNSTTEVKIAMIAMDIAKTGIAECDKPELLKIKAIFDREDVKAWVKMPVLKFLDGTIKKIKDSKEKE